MASAVGRRSYVRLHRDIVELILSNENQYSKENVEKALSSSGHKDKEATLKWLSCHTADPTLNTKFQREYIIFLCPTGPLLSEISKFYELSFNRCGGNSAHNLFPHITLSSFFKVDDSVVPYMLDILTTTIQTYSNNQPTKLQLVLQRSEGYIGLFLTDQSHTWVADALSGFLQRVETELGVQIKPQDRQFHLTLAYNFAESKTEELENLAKKVNIDAPARWELNIYSRDPRHNGKQFQLAIYDFKASEPDELDLKQNCHVIIENELSQQKGWLRGTAFETGKTGFFPENFTKKTAEWRVWMKNISLPITHAEKIPNRAVDEFTNHKLTRRSQSMNLKKDRKDNRRSSLRNLSKTDRDKKHTASAATWETVVRTSTAINPKIANDVKQRSFDSQSSTEQRIRGVLPKSENNNARSRNDVDKRSSRRNAGSLGHQTSGRRDEIKRVFIMRHAERVDLTFGHDWFHLYIDERGYHRRNLNLPRRIPTRRGGPKDFFMDGPISEVGTFQAKLIGEALRAKGTTFTAVYSSPSLRCVQTATSLLEGLMDPLTKIKIEPALFEWMAWCRNTLPKFMTPDELIEYGLNIDRSYIAYFPFSQFNLHEKTEEYYYRSHSFVDSTLKLSTGNVLLVGHSASLDVCSRQLTGHPIRKTDDLIRVVQKVPFCGLCTVEEQPNRSWNLVQTPIPSLAHGQNQTFDWKVLETTASGPPYTR